VTVWNGKTAHEKSELVARSDKMTSERDRLIKERTTAEKQLREAELKLKEMIDKVRSTAVKCRLSSLHQCCSRSRLQLVVCGLTLGRVISNHLQILLMDTHHL